MLSKIRRYASHAAAVAVVGGLVATAGALGLVGTLTIHAPVEVWAGNPILGHVTGSEGPTNMTANCSTAGFPTPVLPPLACGDPIYFTIATLEPMAPSVLTITVSDLDENDTATVNVK